MSGKSEELIRKSAINLVLFSMMVILTVAVLVFAGVTILYPVKNFDNFTVSILITVVAAFTENLCEPYYVCMLLKMEFQMRAKAESVSIFVKSVLIYFLIYKGLGLLGYALAQIAYGIVLVSMYSFINSGGEKGLINEYYTVKEVKTNFEKGDKWYDKYILKDHMVDLAQFSQLCVLKFVLTEGEKIVIFYFTANAGEGTGEKDKSTI